jgi:hypothetical protein
MRARVEGLTTSSSLSDAALSCIVCAIKKAMHIVKEGDGALPLL